MLDCEELVFLKQETTLQGQDVTDLFSGVKVKRG